MDLSYIASYYKTNKLAYSLFHTLSDAMYMGISRDGKYKNEDLYEAGRTVERYIKPSKTRRILELATGRGATSIYLAKKYTFIEFDGIDISPGQLDFAHKKAKKYANYHPVLGDYHDLSKYEPNSFDIVFIIEALCYSKDKEIVLHEVKRVLKPDGKFIILDAYRTQFSKLGTKEEKEAMQLTERGMAVEYFETYESFRKTVIKSEYNFTFEEDVSEFILPTAYRFETTASFFTSLPLLTNILVKIFSPKFTWNAIAGLLMPELIKRNLACYYITVLKK